MDLSDIVMKVKKQKEKEEANGGPVKPTPTIDLHAANGPNGSPSSQSHAKQSSPTTFLHPNGQSNSTSTPPHSPLRSKHSPSQPQQSPTSPASPTSPNGRPKHRSQASFDWFGDRPSRSPERMPRGSGRTESPGGGSSGVSNAAAIRFPGEGRAKVSKKSGEVPLAESPMERSEDEDEAGEVGQEKTTEVGRGGKDGGGGLRGAFTAEDKQRGAKALRQWSGDSDPSSKEREKDRRRSASMGASDREKEMPGSRGRSLSLSRPSKAKSTRTAQGPGTEDDTEWEDENRDQFPSAPTSPGQKRSQPQATRKQSLWGSLARTTGAGDHSGTSTPDGGSDNEAGASGGERRPSQHRRGSAWGVVRSKLKTGSGSEKDGSGKKKGKTGETLTGHELISELTTGILPMVLVKMSLMDRDERGDHRIPILMNYLKLKITDSLYPFHDRHAVFRIELEYGDAAVKWVIYRELKDFVNLHAHYRVANLRQGVDKFPNFPKTSIPYLNWLKNERGNVGKADFARAQRLGLEDYLLKLIRATMFRPEANRLCKFLEISAMSLSLATRGGEQGKQGYLSILSSGASRRKPTGFHPLSWKKRHEPKWFIVRDSYVVATDDPSSTEVYDVIMVDFTFELERPKRILRQGLNLVTGGNTSTDDLPTATTGITGGEDEEALSNEPKPQGHRGAGDPNDPSTTDVEGQRLKDSSNHTFYLKTSERKLRLVAKTERQQDQFIASIEKMLAKTIWAGKNRFDSFAPIRLNASAQWLIDGRDYYWSLSRAILLAKHKIYIHDWWLSPELYLRRPAALNEKFRLDKLLQRKAREGVQIFVIVYKEVSNDFTPVDSNYTKTRLRGLHPNIHVQRSPSHTSTGTLLWSHHEKMCVVDETIGFMGGFDLCFGRWDTPGHVLIDDGPNVVFDPEMKDADHSTKENSQIWPGKDYCNQRVLDFHTLNKPEEDMYDRSKVPRQPWHDIGLQIIGQPARDLCRHFIQRWNFLLRTKNHSIKMPFLIPAPDFTPRQLQEQRITGTCEIQICRSVGPWSMGISHIEHSIQNAYIKAIQLSDHFVYIENQFFISSTEVEGTAIENKIGDALVSRIIRAHSEGTPWRAVIVIPLVPGYPYPIDHSDAGSVRLIMECQFATICRGPHSIFARLRREGIDPDEYITFFGLRGWGKLGSGALTTEAVYIHAKAMIVDDRTVIIGSANINERSQRGDRDSELACIIRDTDMIDSTMAGQPYKVGRFAHTMRVRLMREHLGVDVDELEAEEGTHEDLLKKEANPDKMQEEKDAWDPDHEQEPHGEGKPQVGDTLHWARSLAKSAAENTGNVAKGMGEVVNLGMQKGGENVGQSFGIIEDKMRGASAKEIKDEENETDADRIVDGTKEGKGFASTVVPTLEEKVMAEGRPPAERRDSAEDVSSKPTITVKERQQGTSNRPPRMTDGDIEEDQPGAERQDQPKHSRVEEDAQRHHGEKTTMQSPDTDDTRKLDVDPEIKQRVDESSNEVVRPLAPITETSTNDISPHRIQDMAPPPDISKKPVVNGRPSNDRLSVPSGSPEASESKDDSPPPPPSSFDPHSRSHSTSSGSRTLNESTSVKANETAVNRNKITSSLRRNLKEKGKSAYTLPVPAPYVDPHGFSDPLVDSFFKDVWLAAAVRNTQAYRKVFRCVPDDLVQTWKQYREFQTWAERHNKAPKDSVPDGDDEPFSDPNKHQGTHGAGGGGSAGGVMGQGVNDPPPGETMYKKDSNARRSRAASSVGSTPGESNQPPKGRERSSTLAGEGHDHEEGFPAQEREHMTELLESMSGTLVIFPTRFLEAESAGSNFLFSKDRLPPLSIYD